MASEHTNSAPPKKNILVIVSHPKDVTLWCGGFMEMHPEHSWFVISLCQANGKKKDALHFFKALDHYGARGIISNLNDHKGHQLPFEKIQHRISGLLPNETFDIVITHHIVEAFNHINNRTISIAVVRLWALGVIRSKELWTFAYQSENTIGLPEPAFGADITYDLTFDVWKNKLQMITHLYNYTKHSYEAKSVTCIEAFWQFKTPKHVIYSLAPKSYLGYYFLDQNM
ncbi:hypothetical protein ACG2LH_17105 [Zhouia sp. PK063]|uniref:hypothetical protein n=1 Tax=Zhouia sp. PK063 TaxID=3373602 RepID=UPI0037B50019